MGNKNIYNNFFDKDIWDKVNPDNKSLLDDFVTELKQNKKSNGTIYQYQKDIMGFFCFVYTNIENKSVLDLSKRDVRKYSLYLTQDCGLSSARHNRVLSSIRSMLTFAENDDDTYDYMNNVARKVKGLPKESVREIFFLTDEQVLKLKNKLIEDGDYQKATLLMLAYDSAARKAELSQVNKLSFMDDNKSNTNKVVGKRRKVFNLLYFSGTKECAKLYLEQRGEDNVDSMWYVGTGENRRPASSEDLYMWFMHIRKLLFEMEGKEIDINPHSLRHSSLTNYGDGTHYVCRELGTGGFELDKLKLIAHHTDISTTSGYLPDKSDDELQSMFNIKIDK